MADQKAPRTDVRDPNTGETMVLDTRYSADFVAGQVYHNTALASGAKRVADRVREKEQQSGRVYVNPRTGYRMRLKDDEAAPTLDATKVRRTGADDDRGGDAYRGDPNEADRLRARLRELESGSGGY